MFHHIKTLHYQRKARKLESEIKYLVASIPLVRDEINAAIIGKRHQAEMVRRKLLALGSMDDGRGVIKVTLAAFAVVLGLLMLNAELDGDQVQEEQAAADHKAEIVAKSKQEYRIEEGYRQFAMGVRP